MLGPAVPCSCRIIPVAWDSQAFVILRSGAELRTYIRPRTKLVLLKYKLCRVVCLCDLCVSLIIG